MNKMVKCKTCGAEIAKSAKTCPHCGAKNNQMSLGARIALVVIILFLVIVIAIASGSSGSGQKGDEPQKVGTSSQPEQTGEPEQTEFYVGDIVSIKNVEVTFVSCEKSYGVNYVTPDSGNVYLICEFFVENKSNRDIAVSSVLSFEAYVDDYSTSMSLLSGLLTDKGTLDGTVAAGKKLSGAICYEVPEDFESLEIRFTPDFWSGKDVTFIATNDP